ncbi:hypothetical protein KIH87_15245 [Paraneptunicella aestuarii]|uniref:hypothetical protein n=1 Tax=Paraneptunicella aestuarii TaxID=2831148 RepID=UPI001E3A07A1|nr:hypothetical protein [Paraneptunicella aestuarii]UAA38033.1 hypothetical protein KIH87_15245 [Paraneptunicella aestuarii]
MIDYAVAFIIGNVWAICFLVAGLYNFYFRKEYKPVLHMSLVLACTFAVSKVIYSQFILPQEHLLSIYYLYWAAACGFIILCLVVDHHIQGFVFHWPAKLAISLLLIEIVLHLSLHIDRNIVALNSALQPNRELESAWWLWTVRSIFVNLDNAVILMSVLLPFKAFRSELDIYKTEYSSVQMDKVFKRIHMLEDIIFIMPDGNNKTDAYQCIESARFLLEQWGIGGEERRHLYSANVLCDRARTLALYVGGKLERKLNDGKDDVVDVDY